MYNRPIPYRCCPLKLSIIDKHMHYFQIEKNSSQGLEMILTLLTSESCDLSSQWDKDWVNSITEINNWSVILMLAPQPCHNKNLLVLVDICILYIIRLSIKARTHQRERDL